MQIKKDIPENHGLSSQAVLDFFAHIEHLGLKVGSFMLLQNGKATARFCRKPYREDGVQLLFSLSKSFTSIAAGIARDSGLLDLNDKVISFFPDKLPERISDNLEKMTVHHLLSMNTGHHENIYGAVAKEEDWVKAFLSLDVRREPGSFYLYNTHATYMVSAIIERVAGQSLVDFLMPRLFEPLGIPRPSWETCPKGTIAGGMGLSLATESIAKFGQMLLDKGMYDGRRIVSESYIELATRKQSDNRSTAAGRPDWGQGYGYQFHMCRRGAFRGDGAFGQLCFVAPREKIVIAATSSFTDMKPLQTLLDLIYEHILDKLDKHSSMLPDEHAELEQRISSMMSPVAEAQPLPENTPNLDGHLYAIGKNPHQLSTIRFSMRGERLEVEFGYENETGRKVLPFHLTQPERAEDVFVKDLSLHRQEVVTYSSWPDCSTLKLTLVYIETPYVVAYTFKFSGPVLQLEFYQNVSFSPVKELHINGELISVQD
ncbi:serine hydrolase domain-containing protein [Paenibacillus hamazuiensis]|uniref:serine hydrolase domain-containing protein n=1 Tax=Paenibacillus hamazuiensis TaxID=2936508 RepID=UPI00200CFC51|nr:serine hydrolase [Paenibacillus hamazuiensis]